ncbi:MAG: inositol monophosphatase [Bacteroidales bacterium]|nr:inositol monophosphatase [Bacteroidales bacterium]
MNYEHICKSTVDIATSAGQFIHSKLGKQVVNSVESKGKHNFVTEVDKAAEKQIVEALQKLIPESGFIAEEGTSTKKGERFNWIIDPLDGTTNFIHGAPPVSVSIALMENDEIVVGVVYEIFLKECFYAWKGSPAYLNGKEIHVSTAGRVSDSLIATGFPYHNFDRLKGFMQSLEYFFNNSHGVRRLGSAATDLAYVACGRYEAFYEYNLNPWDLAAGTFLIQQAGGRSTDFKGGNNYLFGKELVSANANVFNEFLEKVGGFMNK